MISPNDIDWVRQVNDRWIVRESLREDAAAFLDHLAAIDPLRLGEACRRARLLTKRHPLEDPKPWFYGGLFSVATGPEASRYLSGHDFTIACIPKFAKSDLGALRIEGLGEETAEKILRIRAAMDGMGELETG